MGADASLQGNGDSCQSENPQPIPVLRSSFDLPDSCYFFGANLINLSVCFLGHGVVPGIEEWRESVQEDGDGGGGDIH